MTDHDSPLHLLVRASGEESPLWAAGGTDWPEIDAFTRPFAIDDLAPAMPEAWAERLRAWSLRTRQPQLPAHARQGLDLAQEMARYLGRGWVVRYWDEQHTCVKYVCWACPRLHWIRDAHATPPPPLHIVVAGEYAWYPLRAEGFEDFAPDDPAAGLDLSDCLTADFYRWSADFDKNMNQYLQERDEEAGAARRRVLDRRGAALAARLAEEAGPGRTVTYGGLM